jgi:hypothetical protein
MSVPEPDLRWYQFSLRSLLLFTVFVAVLCSIGACTHWSISATIAAILLIAGVSGGMVAGTRVGLVVGAVYGIPGFAFAVVALFFLTLPVSLFWGLGNWAILSRVAVVIGGILGGVLGGLLARNGS